MSAKADQLGTYFLDVGQGDCSFVIDGAGAGVLFDCADAQVAQKFVLDQGIRRLAAVVASHLDTDHIQGMHSFLQWFVAQPDRELDDVYLGLDRPKAELSDTALKLLRAVMRWSDERLLTMGRAEREGRPKTIWQSGDTRVDIVLPLYASQLGAHLGGGEKPNPSSAVLRVVRGETAILIGGDAPLGSWERVETHLLPARLLRSSHHGGKIDEGAGEWTMETLYDRVGADDVVVSVGTNNGHKHPIEEHIRSMQRIDRRRVLCTQLTPRCHPDPQMLRSGFEGRTSEVLPPYRHQLRKRKPPEVPCAGSVVAWIDASGAVEVIPRRGEWHDKFVGRVDAPLCRPAQ